MGSGATKSAASSVASGVGAGLRRMSHGPPVPEMNPVERMAGKKMVEIGMFDEKEVERLYRSYARLRGADTRRMATLEDVYHFFRVEQSAFTTQVFLLPLDVPIEGVNDENFDKVEMEFTAYSLAIWIICSFELATLAFNMMDEEGCGELTRDQIKEVRNSMRSADGSG